MQRPCLTNLPGLLSRASSSYEGELSVQLNEKIVLMSMIVACVCSRNKT